MSACEHIGQFEAELKVTRLTDEEDGPVTGWTADIKLTCAECGEKFVWLGPGGSRPDSPTVSVDGLELRAPCVPEASGESIIGKIAPRTVGDA